MNLVHLTEHRKCPHCGSVPVKEEIETHTSYGLNRKRTITKHTCGDRNEMREFLCGAIVRYRYGGWGIVHEGMCRNSLKHAEQVQKQEKLYADLVKTIERLEKRHGIPKGNLKEHFGYSYTSLKNSLSSRLWTPHDD